MFSRELAFGGAHIRNFTVFIKTTYFCFKHDMALRCVLFINHRYNIVDLYHYSVIRTLMTIITCFPDELDTVFKDDGNHSTTLPWIYSDLFNNGASKHSTSLWLKIYVNNITGVQWKRNVLCKIATSGNCNPTYL